MRGVWYLCECIQAGFPFSRKAVLVAVPTNIIFQGIYGFRFGATFIHTDGVMPIAYEIGDFRADAVAKHDVRGACLKSIGKGVV